MTWREFKNQSLNKPGIVVWFEEGLDGWLIGDINSNGGVCDCCTAMREKAIVIAYQTLENL